MTGRRWVVAGGVLLLVVALGVAALAGSCVVLIRQQVDVRDGERAETFEQEAADVLARIGDVPPLVEETPTGPRLSPGMLERRKAMADGRVPSALHILVWAPDEEKIVRLSLPLWLLRLAPDGMKIDVDDVDLRDLRLSIADLERAGPGPLLIRNTPRSRVLVWTE
jgi:hypothetical protein